MGDKRENEIKIISESPNFKRKATLPEATVINKEIEYKDLVDKIKFYEESIDKMVY